MKQELSSEALMPNVLDEVTAFPAQPEPSRIAVGAHDLITEAMSLRDLRKALGQTQREIAKRLNVQQCAVSKYETRNDMSVSKLRNYLRAMGAELELVAVFPDRSSVRVADLVE